LKDPIVKEKFEYLKVLYALGWKDFENQRGERKEINY